MQTSVTTTDASSTNVALEFEQILQTKTKYTPGILLSKELSLTCDSMSECTFYLYKDSKCHNRFSVADGWCALTKVEGAFGGLAESINLRLDDNGNWEAFLKRGSNLIQAGMRAIMIEPVE